MILSSLASLELNEIVICTCICMYVATCSHMYVPTYIPTCMQPHVCSHMYVPTCMQPYVCTYMYVPTCMQPHVCSHMYVAICMQLYVCSHMYVPTCMQPHVCSHMYVAICMQLDVAICVANLWDPSTVFHPTALWRCGLIKRVEMVHVAFVFTYLDWANSQQDGCSGFGDHYSNYQSE